MLPPIIDRELFFGNPEITHATLSPDGSYLAFVRPWNGTLNIWVKEREAPFEKARLLTTETGRPIADYLWTRDGKYVVYVKDNEGDENFNCYAVDPSVASKSLEEAPPARDLTGLTGVQVHLYSAPKNDPDVLYIGLNDRDAAWHDLYRLQISSGERTLLRQNTERIAGWFFDLKGELRLAFRLADNGDQELLRVDPEQLTPIYTASVFESVQPLRFHSDNRRVYLESNHGDEIDLTRLELLDPESGELEVVEADPLGRVDFNGAGFHEVTDELIYTVYDDDQLRRYFRDPVFEADFRYLEAKLPGREVGFESRTRDDRFWMVTADSDREPGETYIFDRVKRTIEPQFRVREKLPRESLAEMQAIRYASSDGLEIPAYLVLPHGLEPVDLPLLAMVHGGPWARDEWGYNSLAQFFANRGYAVLMPNFRGSTGFGKKFLNAGNGAWGREMQDDITWGVKHLVETGVADPTRVGILGGSYGGYATLAGVAFTPDVYAAAVDIVGPSNLNTMLDSIPAYWEAGRKLLHARMADPATEEGKAWLNERSPLFSADKIRTPLLVVQGANDPRVRRAEAEQIVIALRDRGFPVEYMLAPDEGHGFANPVNNMAMFMAAEKFLAKHLGGRFQEGGAPEVVKRLAAITVDPATVKLTRKIDAATIGVPAVIATLKAGRYEYKASLQVQGQSIPVSMAVVIEEQDGKWKIAEELGIMGQSMHDAVVLDKAALTLISRTTAGDGPEVNVTFEGGAATSGIFADGPGFAQVLACLPLTEGYTALFRNFDVQKERARAMRLEVTGSEDVEVPAGKFETYRVEVESAEQGPERSTIWVAKGLHKAVKFSSIMPEMGGAELEAELMQ